MCLCVTYKETNAIRRNAKGETQMKKLMTLMLGLSFVLGTVAVSFAQDQPAAAPKTQKTKKKKAPGKKKGATKNAAKAAA